MSTTNKSDILALLQKQRPEEARALCEQMVRARPDDARLWGLLGAIYGMLENPGEAERCAREAIRLKPDYAEAHNNLGLVLQHQGLREEAKQHLREATRLNPDYADAYFNLGGIFKAEGCMEDATKCYREATLRKPHDPEILLNLGTSLAALDQHAEAITAYRLALQLNSNSADIHNNWGVSYESLNNLKEAIPHYKRAVEIRPDYAEAHNNLAGLLVNTGDLDMALVHCQRAIEIRPDYAEAYNNLGIAHAGMGNLNEAGIAYQRALELKPDNPDAHINFGTLQKKLGHFGQAVASYQKALALHPDHPIALRNLGNVMRDFRKYDEALDYCERAIAAKPGYVAAYREKLLTILYHPNLPAQQMFQEHRRFENQIASPAYLCQRPHSNTRIPDRRLRIGFLSSDIRNHPVARSLIPLLETINRNRYEIFIYPEISHWDNITKHLRQLADGWHQTGGLDDASVAETIRSNKVDILVCLAGHFDKNRLLVCAYKPAPIQVSYHDVATSGLQAVDYLITDALLSPINTREQFTERLVRLPTFHLHTPLVTVQDAGPPPSTTTGYTTFGSFNNPVKMTPRVIALWARLLKAVPNSKLLLKYRRHYTDSEFRQNIVDEFASNKISSDRLILNAQSDSIAGHLSTYRQIDIAIDPFPFNGATTTFEALWMGVPVIALEGQTMVSRWGLSMLTRAGLPELLAKNEDQYIEIARQLAGDLSRLEELRASLRNQIARSPLCNSKARTRQIERVFRYMWRKWCQTGTDSL